MLTLYLCRPHVHAFRGIPIPAVFDGEELFVWNPGGVVTDHERCDFCRARKDVERLIQKEAV